jgi:hypothetical protein
MSPSAQANSSTGCSRSSPLHRGHAQRHRRDAAADGADDTRRCPTRCIVPRMPEPEPAVTTERRRGAHEHHLLRARRDRHRRRRGCHAAMMSETGSRRLSRGDRRTFGLRTTRLGGPPQNAGLHPPHARLVPAGSGLVRSLGAAARQPSSGVRVVGLCQSSACGGVPTS